MKHLFLLSILLSFILQATGQDGRSFWQKVDPSTLTTLDRREIKPAKFQSFQLDFEDIKTLMNQAPAERNSQNAVLDIAIPTPNGVFETFEIVSYHVLPASLEAQYPGIRTFLGRSKVNPLALIRLDFTTQGFHAKVWAPDMTWMIDPASMNSTEYYLVYRKKDVVASAFGSNRRCGTDEEGFALPENIGQSSSRNGSGNELLTYQAAIVADELYTNFHGGVTQALSAITSVINRSNGVYERDAAIRLELVANQNAIIYTSANDPYTVNDFPPDPQSYVPDMAAATPPILNSVIGSPNYDFGQVFSIGPSFGIVGTAGGIGTVCGSANLKGRACTTDTSPVGTDFEVTLVHEFGHQFNATHTFNSVTANCNGNRTAFSAYEPGNGSTIMGYPGCGGDQISSDRVEYYHVNSYERVHFYTRVSTGNNCPDITPTGNTPPSVDAGPGGYFIPINTPFQLNGSGSDPDGDTLTFCWEQYDLGPAGSPNSPSGNAPILRSYFPTPDSFRVFPRYEDLVDNFQRQGEILPSYSRNLNFRLSVRDNNIASGGLTYEQITLTVTDQAGPFEIMTQNLLQTSYEVGDDLLIEWDVANTDQSPVNVQKVKITMSEDGGFTYPHILSEETDNDGFFATCVPAILGNQIRIKVEAIDNIFFDINNQNFTIADPVVSGFSFFTEEDTIDVCADGFGFLNFNSCEKLDNSSQFTIQGLGLPPGMTVTSSPSPVTPGEDFDLVIEADPSLAVGSYPIALAAFSPTGASFSATIVARVVPSEIGQVEASYPTATNSATPNPQFTWDAIEGVGTYIFELAATPLFGNTIIYADSNLSTPYTSVPFTLATQTAYYWRVRGKSICGEGPVSQTYAFRTGVCASVSNNIPQTLPIFGNPAQAISSVNFTQSGTVADVNVVLRGIHENVNDLEAFLEGPGGQEIQLFSRICENLDEDFLIGFDDEGTDEAVACPPTDGVMYQPIDPLSTFDNQQGFGTWTLTVNDVANFNAGELQEWSLEVCLTTTSNIQLLNNNPLTVPQSGTGAISTPFLEATSTGTSASDLQFTIVDAPSNGELQLNGSPLVAGATFTQEDINNGILTYTQDGSAEVQDLFRFTISDPGGGWLGTPEFSIDIISKNESSLDQIQALIQPNPASDFVDIKILNQGNTGIRVLNLQGQEVWSTKTYVSGQESIRLNTNTWAKGLYLVEVSQGQSLWSEKLIVE